MNKTVIDLLNQARARELTAIMQYMIHHYELADQDYGKLATRMKEIAIEEMKHAERLAERILFLGGTPVTKLDGEIAKGQDIPDIYKTGEALEQGAVTMYNAASAKCAQELDQISKELFEELLAEEEVHLDYFQNVTDHLQKMGNAYLANQTG